MKRAMARRITIGPKRKGDKPQTREGLRRVIVQTLPMDDAELLDQASEEIERALADYRTLKAANDAQLTARQARVWLKRGTQLLNRLERWLIDVEPTVVRDYVLSGARSLAAKRRRSELMRPMWNEKLSEIHLWQDRFNQSLLFVRTDRGKPENFPLKQLVRDLAKIWEKYTALSFTNTRKGQQRPRDFVLAICQTIQPVPSKAQIETAVRHAVRKTPGRRRGRKSRSDHSN